MNPHKTTDYGLPKPRDVRILFSCIGLKVSVISLLELLKAGLSIRKETEVSTRRDRLETFRSAFESLRERADGRPFVEVGGEIAEIRPWSWVQAQ